MLDEETGRRKKRLFFINHRKYLELYVIITCFCAICTIILIGIFYHYSMKSKSIAQYDPSIYRQLENISKMYDLTFKNESSFSNVTNREQIVGNKAKIESFFSSFESEYSKLTSDIYVNKIDYIEKNFETCMLIKNNISDIKSLISANLNEFKAFQKNDFNEKINNNLIFLKENMSECKENLEYFNDKYIIKLDETRQSINLIEYSAIALVTLVLVISFMYGFILTNILKIKKENENLFEKIDADIINSDNPHLAITQILKIVGEQLEWDVGIFWSNVVDKLVFAECWANTPEMKDFLENYKIYENEIGLDLPVRPIMKNCYIGINDTIDSSNYVGRSLSYKYNLHCKAIIPIKHEKMIYGVFEYFGTSDQVNNKTIMDFYEKVGSHIGKILYKLRSDQELQEAKKLLEQQNYALEASAIVAITDLRGKIKYANEKFVEISGYSKEELIGSDHRIINSKYHTKEFFINLWKTISHGEIWRGEVRNKRKNGTYYWVQSIIVPTRDSSGRVWQYVSIRYDITEKKVAELALLETKKLLEQQNFALDASAIVAITDLRGKIKYVNEKFTQISGYSREELIGSDHRIINSNYHSKEFFVNLWKTISHGEIWRDEVRNKRKNGTYYWVNSTIVPTRDPSGRIWQYVSIRYDITEKKEMEYAVLKSKEEAELATKIKGQFLANMSHEIRTPLNAILGMVAILSDEVKTQNAKKYLGIIKSSGDNLLSLVNDILDFSKIEAQKLLLENVTFNLEEIVRESKSILELKAREKGLEIFIDIDPNISKWISADITCLRQLLINLISNAIKFTQKGSVTIRATDFEDSDRNYTIKFDIIDTGMGLSESAKEKLFKSFSQVDASTTRKFGGTGLGLAICKGICEAMGGRIWVESELEKGSVFSFTFLAKKCEEGINIQKESDLDPKMGFKMPLRILVADDHANNQFLATKFLEKLGYNADVVSNGKEVLDVIKLKEYDVIFMDCQMPELDGFETTKQLHQSYEEEKRPWIIALTANVSSEDQEKCEKYGMDDFIGKPFSIHSIVTSLSRVSEKSVKLNYASQPSLMINKEIVLNHFARDKSVMKSYIDLFLVYYPKMIDSIEVALKQENAKDLEISAHRLKGSVSSFFVQDIVVGLYKLEKVGENNNMSEANSIFKDVKAKLENLIVELKSLV